MIANRNAARARMSAAALALVLGALPATTPALAQNGLDQAITFGSCESLIVAGRDRTRSCEGRLLSGHSGGRSAFAFRLGATNQVSFAGPDGPAAGDRATIALDMVLVWRDREMPQSGPEMIPASGSCTYAGPQLGTSTVACTATTAQGPFSVIFHNRSDQPDAQPNHH